MKLKMITDRTGFFEGVVSVGLYIANGKNAILIDSGSDDSAARKIANQLEKEQLKLAAIVNTHSHADHCGGNAHLQKRTGCRVYACGIEAAMIRDTLLEPMYLYGGGPLEALKNKFLQAPPTDEVIRLTAGVQRIEDADFELIALPGHSPEMVGVRTPDDVVFLGDGLIGAETAARHRILYNFNAGDAYASLTKMMALEAQTFVLSHGGICDDVAALAADNRGRLDAVNDVILKHLNEPIGREQLLEQVMSAFGITPSVPLYYLNLGIISSHLAYLCSQGKVEAFMEGHRLRYRGIPSVG